MSKKGRAATLERQARLEALKAQQAKQARRRVVIISSVTAPVIAVLVVLAVLGIHNGATSKLGSDIPGLLTYTGLSRTHVTTAVHYPQTPPVGGNHNPVWQNCGAYDTPIKNENGVHSLEHGTVWITYQPSLPAAQVASLDAHVKGNPYVLVSPYPGLPAPVVASAWGYQVRLTGASDPRLVNFIKDFEQGPQTPEPRAACIGGTGTPKLTS